MIDFALVRSRIGIFALDVLLSPKGEVQCTNEEDPKERNVSLFSSQEEKRDQSMVASRECRGGSRSLLVQLSLEHFPSIVA